MLPEKKKQLSKTLAEELNERSNEKTVSHAEALKELELTLVNEYKIRSHRRLT